MSSFRTMTRRAAPRPTVYSVRLNTEEVAVLQEFADEAGLPASTLVRFWIIEPQPGQPRTSASLPAGSSDRPPRRAPVVKRPNYTRVSCLSKLPSLLTLHAPT